MSAIGVAEEVRAAPSETVDSGRLIRRLWHRPLAVVCLLYLALVALVAVLAPVLLPGVSGEQAGDLLRVHEAPSWDHVLGTDSLGRDILSRLLVGTRVTMVGVMEAVVVAVGVGVPLGIWAGYFGGRLDRAAGWLGDVAFSLPGVAIVLVVLSVFRESMLAAMTALGLLAAPALARVVRSATLPVREELYIAAAQVSGLSHTYIIARHILPRIAGAVIVLAALFAAGALLAQTGLAYLGLIVTAPEPSWGGMVGDGIANIVLQPWLIWPPGIMMTLTVLAFGLLGDLVRDSTTERWAATRVRPRTRRPAEVAHGNAVASDALLAVDDLAVSIPAPGGDVDIVRGVTFDVKPGETVGIVGESGCGKTVTALSVLGLPPADGAETRGRIIFEGRDLATLSESALRGIRGREIGFISQEPMVGLNPAYRVGWQIALSLRVHRGMTRRAAKEHAVTLLRRVHLSSPDLVARSFPHELSGGMAQRVGIARALAGDPKLLIADEPTTALDVTVQAEILDLLRDLQRERGMAILLITHDWGVIADICDRAIVMYAGEIVEHAPIVSMYRQPAHPYTQALLASNPHQSSRETSLPTIPGSVPKPGAWPNGCHFHPRCRYSTAECTTQPIPIEHLSSDRETRCIHYERLLAK